MTTRLKEALVVAFILAGFVLLAVGTSAMRNYMVAYRAEQALTVEAPTSPVRPVGERR